MLIACWAYVTGRNMDAQAFLTRGAQVIIRMRGLPYDCTAKQVVSILTPYKCNILQRFQCQPRQELFTICM